MKTKEENDAMDWHEEFRKWERGFWKKVFAAIIAMIIGLLILSSMNTISSKVIGWYIVVAFLIFGVCLWVWLNPSYKRDGIFDQIEKEKMEVKKNEFGK